jgi:hypothetical protein
MPNNKWTKIGAAFPHKEGIGFSTAVRKTNALHALYGVPENE